VFLLTQETTIGLEYSFFILYSPPFIQIACPRDLARNEALVQSTGAAPVNFPVSVKITPGHLGQYSTRLQSAHSIKCFLVRVRTDCQAFLYLQMFIRRSSEIFPIRVGRQIHGITSPNAVIATEEVPAPQRSPFSF